MRRAWPLCLALLVLAPAARAAAPRALGSAESFPFLSLSGGQVVFASSTLSGSHTHLAVYVQPLAGGAPRRIFGDSFVPFEQVNADVDDTNGESVAASPQAVAVAFEDAQETGVAASGDADLDFGPDGGHLAQVEHCHDDEGEPTFDGSFHVEGARLAWISQCGATAGDLLVRDLTGAVRVIAQAAGDSVFTMAGDFLAYTTGSITRVVNLATGASTDVPAPGPSMALQSDGKLVVGSGPHCAGSVSWFDPGGTVPHPLPAVDPCGLRAFTGDRVVYLGAGSVLHMVALGGADRALFPVRSVAAEGNDAAVVSRGCALDTLYAIALDGSTTAPVSPSSCPMRVRSRRLRLRGGRVRVELSCPRGCDTEVALSSRNSPRAGVVAEGGLRILPPHTHGSLILKVSRAGQRALRGGTHRRYLYVTPNHDVSALRGTRAIRVTVAG